MVTLPALYLCALSGGKDFVRSAQLNARRALTAAALAYLLK